MSCVMAWQGLDLVGVLVSVGTAAHSEELSVYLALGVFLTFQPLPMGAPPPQPGVAGLAPSPDPSSAPPPTSSSVSAALHPF